MSTRRTRIAVWQDQQRQQGLASAQESVLRYKNERLERDVWSARAAQTNNPLSPLFHRGGLGEGAPERLAGGQKSISKAPSP